MVRVGKVREQGLPVRTFVPLRSVHFFVLLQLFMPEDALARASHALFAMAPSKSTLPEQPGFMGGGGVVTLIHPFVSNVAQFFCIHSRYCNCYLIAGKF